MWKLSVTASVAALVVAPAVADDTMVTPLIHLSEGAVLSWRGRAHGENYSESHQVRYSTTGTDVASLFSQPACGVGTDLEESSLWGGRSIDLDDTGLAGLAARFAFRNPSDDLELLAIDFVEVAQALIFRDGSDSGFAGAWSSPSGESRGVTPRCPAFSASKQRRGAGHPAPLRTNCR